MLCTAAAYLTDSFSLLSVIVKESDGRVELGSLIGSTENAMPSVPREPMRKVIVFYSTKQSIEHVTSAGMDTSPGATTATKSGY